MHLYSTQQHKYTLPCLREIYRKPPPKYEHFYIYAGVSLYTWTHGIFYFNDGEKRHWQHIQSRCRYYPVRWRQQKSISVFITFSFPSLRETQPENRTVYMDKCHLHILCSTARAPVAQLARASDRNSEDQVRILAGSQCLFFAMNTKRLSKSIGNICNQWTLIMPDPKCSKTQ